ETFAEAVSPAFITQNNTTGVLAFRTGTVPAGETAVYTLKPQSNFVNKLQGATLTGQSNEESGALLYLILVDKTISAGGAMASAGDDLGKQRQVMFGNVPLQTFADAWGNSIGFRRTFGSISSNPAEDEVQQAEYVGSVNSFDPTNKDPLDPRNL